MGRSRTPRSPAELSKRRHKRSITVTVDAENYEVVLKMATQNNCYPSNIVDEAITAYIDMYYKPPKNKQ